MYTIEDKDIEKDYSNDPAQICGDFLYETQRSTVETLIKIHYKTNSFDENTLKYYLESLDRFRSEQKLGRRTDSNFLKAMITRFGPLRGRIVQGGIDVNSVIAETIKSEVLPKFPMLTDSETGNLDVSRLSAVFSDTHITEAENFARVDIPQLFSTGSAPQQKLHS